MVSATLATLFQMKEKVEFCGVWTPNLFDFSKHPADLRCPRPPTRVLSTYPESLNLLACPLR
jgi:hypothetical protein